MRKKKSKKVKEEVKEEKSFANETNEGAVTVPELPKKAEIGKLDADFPNEGLNNVVRKINEIIEYLNAL